MHLTFDWKKLIQHSFRRRLYLSEEEEKHFIASNFAKYAAVFRTVPTRTLHSRALTCMKQNVLRVDIILTHYQPSLPSPWARKLVLWPRAVEDSAYSVLIMMSALGTTWGRDHKIYWANLLGSAKEWSTGCVIPTSWAPLITRVGFTQPRAHSSAHVNTDQTALMFQLKHILGCY